MIITLCGSSRFEYHFHALNEILTLAGHCVFSISSLPSLHDGVREHYTPDEKITLDIVHKKKIENSRAIVVINEFAYIGESTLSEIKHAQEKAVSIYYLESWAKGCGIGANHYQYVRLAKVSAGIPIDYLSPIDTFEDGDRQILFFSELLGEGGAKRTRLLHRWYNFCRERYAHFAVGDDEMQRLGSEYPI